MMFEVPYAITKRVAKSSLGDVRPKVQEALAAEGFGVLTEIDVQATLKKKIDVDTAPYVILGACNPKLAHAALTAEPAIGLFLPCNVVLAQDGDDVVVSAVDPKAMFAAMGEPPAAVREVATDAEARLRRAIEKL
jgi:uncharacterized protein (DUF302 family)